tara:strand:- start:22945 stop:23985 length:1041 start_codon:yes stop_codon:yes gene_type:complete
MNFEKHLIKKGSLLKDALTRLNSIIGEKILFIVDNDLTFLGSITDGDIRRGLLDSETLDQKIESLQQPNPKFFFIDKIDINLLIALRNEGYKVIPLIDNKRRIKQLVDFNKLKSFLPLDTIILAGGRGTRLSPLTKKTPKPLLKVGDKPIIKHNFDRLKSYGLKNFWISVNYLKGQIKDYFNSGFEDLNIQYIEEIKPMGTIGSLSIIKNLKQKHVLVTNSDLLTNINYEDFYLDFLKNDADISMVTIPYDVVIPYGVVKQFQNQVQGIKEKPTYTYYSNAGIYLMKKEVFNSIPKNTFINATDLITNEINRKKKVISYPFSGYWLDIGTPEDYQRAQSDINHIKI